jgi:hypothetical protein
MRLAAEQLREIAQGASPGNAPTRIVKLRSSGVYLPVWQNQRRCSAAFVYQGHDDLRFHRRLPTTAAPQRIAQGPPMTGCTRWQLGIKNRTGLQSRPEEVWSGPEISNRHMECGDLSPLYLFNTAFLSIGLGKTVNIPFQFQVKSGKKTSDFPKAKSPEKESGDESPHSKGGLLRGQTPMLRLAEDAIQRFLP